MKLLNKKKLREEYSKKLKFKTKKQASKLKQSKIESLQFLQSKDIIKEDLPCHSLPKLNSNIDNNQNKIIENLELNLKKESIIEQVTTQENVQDDEKISNRETKIKFNNNDSIKLTNKVTQKKYDNNKTSFNIFNQNQNSVETLKQNPNLNEGELLKKNELEKKKEQQRLFREELDRQIKEREQLKQNSVSKKKNFKKIPKITFETPNQITNKDILETPKCREIGLNRQNQNILKVSKNHNIDSQKVTLEAINKIHSKIDNI